VQLADTTSDIHLNSFKEIMADKAVGQINWGRINGYSLYTIMREYRNAVENW
jgi:hypothetical protein